MVIHKGLIYQGGNKAMTVIDIIDHRIVATFRCDGEVRSICVSTDEKFINFYATCGKVVKLYKVNLDVTNIEVLEDFKGTTFARQV